MEIVEAASQHGLADRLMARTTSLHREAERSGIVGDLLRGRAGRHGYVRFLRSLLPIYESLEVALDRLHPSNPVRTIARAEIYRAAALRSDLAVLANPDELGPNPMAPSAQDYAVRIAQAAEGDGALLVAHAYVRYLGDLNGGQVLKRLVGKALDLGPECLHFYAFPAVADPRAFAAAYRDAIDRLPLSPETESLVAAEAEIAFRLNIALSIEVQKAAAGPRYAAAVDH